jgi:hypothetical protein
MASPRQGLAEAGRRCSFCGKPISSQARQCPFCREMVPEVRLSGGIRRNGKVEFRRGLLYMLLAGVIYYFSGGYSGLRIPVAIGSAVTTYLAPLLFLGGLGLSLYGVYLKMR